MVTITDWGDQVEEQVIKGAQKLRSSGVSDWKSLTCEPYPGVASIRHARLDGSSGVFHTGGWGSSEFGVPVGM